MESLSGSSPRVLIAGAGAVGSYFGALMHQAGKNVTLLGRGEHARVMKEEGLVIDSFRFGRIRLRPFIVLSAEEAALAGPFDILFITVKSQQLREMAVQLKELESRLFSEDTILVSLLNGIESEDILAEYFDRNRIVGGLAHVGARIGEPGLLIHTTRGDVFVSTYVNPEIPSVVAGLLKSCDIPGGLEKDLRYISWRKFMMNNAFNAVTALTQTTMGEAVSAPYLKKVLKGCMEETLRISRAEGVSLPDEIIEKTLEAGLTYDRIFTSMYQDVKAGKPTEHEALNGVICRLGIKHGIPTPYNDTLYALLEHRSRQLEKV